MFEWRISHRQEPYKDAVSWMENRVAQIRDGTAPECVWLLEHPPLYTAGTSARSEDLLKPDALPVFQSGRGGQYTYHGPGQRIAYVMMDLKKRGGRDGGGDVRAFVKGLEACLITTLAQFGVTGERRQGRVGIWVDRGDGDFDDKIAAIGVRVRRWVTYHGISLNVDPDLSNYNAIVPCGITGHGVTSLADLGINVSMDEVDIALQSAFNQIFETDTSG